MLYVSSSDICIIKVFFIGGYINTMDFKFYGKSFVDGFMNVPSRVSAGDFGLKLKGAQAISSSYGLRFLGNLSKLVLVSAFIGLATNYFLLRPVVDALKTQGKIAEASSDRLAQTVSSSLKSSFKFIPNVFSGDASYMDVLEFVGGISVIVLMILPITILVILIRSLLVGILHFVVIKTLFGYDLNPHIAESNFLGYVKAHFLLSLAHVTSPFFSLTSDSSTNSLYGAEQEVLSLDNEVDKVAEENSKA